ncbi:pre-mRNA 3' end processing protein WDR33 [Vespula maculifrons]|uniref:Pre-mRNA 3' end processing protein WDR33 n=1 Tax=Vespula maculifrons TaxID=7453 RepID=A0ABD2AZK9_VESMC
MGGGIGKEQESKAGFGKFTIRPICVNSLGWTGSIGRVDGFRKLRVLPICENSLDRASSVEDDIGYLIIIFQKTGAKVGFRKLTVSPICEKSLASSKLTEAIGKRNNAIKKLFSGKIEELRKLMGLLNSVDETKNYLQNEGEIDYSKVPNIDLSLPLPNSKSARNPELLKTLNRG